MVITESNDTPFLQNLNIMFLQVQIHKRRESRRHLEVTHNQKKK